MPSDGELKLPERLSRLYIIMDIDKEMSIDALFDIMFPRDERKLERWQKQQFLGSFITRLNRRIVGQKQKIIPGRTKGTYVLVTL